MSLLVFLCGVFIVSFSGAMQPGPVTATAISMGAKNRWAGVLLAVGHGIVEFPLMVLIILGLGSVFNNDIARVVIGFAGGAVLLYMGVRMLGGGKSDGDVQAEARRDRPILAGIVLTVSNPYFLIWWATVGLAWATKAVGFGIWAFAIFAVVHWFVDLIWVGMLSFASFHGGALMGPKVQKIILKVCGAAMLLFGAIFIYDSGGIFVKIVGQ